MKTILLTILVCILSVQISNAQWVQVSNGMGIVSVTSLAVNGSTLFAGVENSYPGVYLSTNNGANWTQTSLNNRRIQALAVNGSIIFAGTETYGVYKSTNNGTSWTQTTLNNQHVWSVAINGNNVFAGTLGFGLYISTNNGANWTQSSLYSQFVYSIVINGNSIFAATNNGVYLSTNNGVSWSQFGLNNIDVISLAVNGNNILAGVSASSYGGVYLSTNNGISWIQAGLNYVGVSSLAVNGNNIYAGSIGGGVYVSNDNGANWVLRGEGLGYSSVQAFSIFNNYIFAGTQYSVYRRLLNEFVGIQQTESEMPSEFNLSQNYPNPFNPSTSISFSIPSSSKVNLVVFNSAGQQVTELVNENLKAGTYEYQFNAGKLTSGVYFYRLTTDQFADTKKMILVK